ncbi:Protein of unknown function (DUF1320) [Prevotella dentalis DSM 3688]|uniref:DUF1320 domain-containing protein n=1 Tax=Prevotella dentalis (strain ATCC 49559 / DSM 3688 / JCM 13448 / NCTC 12043 / ES 2772) TaxID=908937 RepID=F9D796_PREDD|nr:phage protein Gp36 family protein [Prevotella dentalis]AGB29742.1 Protein of unknown function (DUF1320) [Prevotella dentalis DSM 3688]AGB29827.1 Protein of unknown function (DUF1320) [Prevotella dentalis DSM 3688]EGQ11462.1 hypothetical protein HMPREF9136_2724 [Prevotella dentalis DSM 3688]
MMFLTEEDYKSVCDDFEFENIQADQKRTTAEKAALEMIAGYTSQRYDMRKAFSMTGEARNAMLVQVAVNITLWLMVHRMPESMGYERRQLLYEESVRWLRDIQNSKASPDLPTYTSEDGSQMDTHNPIRWGSQRPGKYDW